MHPLLRHWRLLSVGFLMVAFSAVCQTLCCRSLGGEWRATFGLSHGGLGLANSLIGVIWVERYGRTHLGAIRSLAQSAMIFSTTVAPVSVGLLLDGGWAIELAPQRSC